MADDLVDHNPALPMEATSPEELTEAVGMIHSAFPDFEATVEDVIAEGDRVVTRTTERGTHEGEFAGVARRETGSRSGGSTSTASRTAGSPSCGCRST